MRHRASHATFACLLCLLSSAVSARGQSITLSPAVLPLSGHAGQSVTQVLTLRNDSDLALEFVMEARDVVVENGARRFVEAGLLADSIALSALFEPSEVRLGPQSSAAVIVTLTLPATTRQRAVVTTFRGTSLVQSGAQKALMSIGTLFTFTLSDQLSLRGDELVTHPPSRVANARLEGALSNDGTEPVVPSGMAVILDQEGRLVGKVPFAAKRLLPGEKATVVAEYPGELRPGTYRAVATFDYAGRALTLTGPLVVQ